MTDDFHSKIFILKAVKSFVTKVLKYIKMRILKIICMCCYSDDIVCS